MGDLSMKGGANRYAYRQPFVVQLQMLQVVRLHTCIQAYETFESPDCVLTITCQYCVETRRTSIITYIVVGRTVNGHGFNTIIFGTDAGCKQGTDYLSS